MLIIKATSRYHKESQVVVSLDKSFEAIWNIFEEQNETKYLKNGRKLGMVVHTCILVFGPLIEAIRSGVQSHSQILSLKKAWAS